MRNRILTAGIAALMATQAWAQTSDYIVVCGDNGDEPGVGAPRFVVISAGSIDRDWAPAGGTDDYQYGIAVDATVRTIGRDSGTDGAEYELDGTVTGATYTHDLAILEDCLDGTTDGVFNYTLDLAGTVWRCDGDWTNPVALFTIPSSSFGSITYDREAGTVWIGRWTATQLEEYELDGTPARTVVTGHTRNAALALDHRDGTLWLHDRNSQGTYEQWTRDGTLLQRVTIPGASAFNALGGEFQFPQCDADLNADDTLNLDDIDVFVAAFLGGLPLADLDRNQTFNLDDIDLYVASFLAGCP